MTPLFQSLSEAVVFWGTLVLYYAAMLSWMARTSTKRFLPFAW